jgi:anti-anti-sigma factor
VTALARVEEDSRGDVPIARVHGEVDASNARDIGSRLRTMLSNRSETMVVDLSPTTYIDSAGLNLLFALAEEMRSRQQRLVVVVPDDSPIARMVTVNRHRPRPRGRDVSDARRRADRRARGRRLTSQTQDRGARNS